MIQDLLESDTDGNFKKLNAKLQAAEKALDSKNLTSEQLQIEQGNYNFCAYEMDKEVDKAMAHVSYRAQVDKLKLEEKQKVEEYNSAVNRESDFLREYAPVRRAYEQLEGYYAEAEVLKNGSPEQKLKLLKLYECENQPL